MPNSQSSPALAMYMPPVCLDIADSSARVAGEPRGKQPAPVAMRQSRSHVDGDAQAQALQVLDLWR